MTIKPNLSFHFEIEAPLVEAFITSWVTKYPYLTGRFTFSDFNRKIVKEPVIVEDQDRLLYLGLVSGECYKKGDIFCRVNDKIDKVLPIEFLRPTGTRQLGGGRFEWMYESEWMTSQDHFLIWIFGHEVWHRLCYQKINSGNFETRANAMGFSLLRQFKAR